MSVSDLGKTKKCERCGKKFIVKSPTQKYCSSECNILEQKKQTRIYKGIADKPIQKRAKYGTAKKKKPNKITFGLYHKRTGG